jgi:pyruvate dehydrogenase E2 component (dihydrolipoamide acetyltransferase)
MQVFRFPDLGEGLHEAQVVEWHVAEGDVVAADDPLVSVETDKAVTEVPAPWRGRIAKLCAAVGDTLLIGDEVVRYEDTGATPAAPEPPPAEPDARPRPDRRVATTPKMRRVRVMPAVRMLAGELGLDLAALAGSGPDGMVLARDLAATLRSRGTVAPVPVAAPAAVGDAGGEAGWEVLSGPRRTMARNMELSRQQVAATTVHEEADISGWTGSDDVTVRLVRAMVQGVAAEPALNAWFDARRGRKLLGEIDLGLAVDTSDGLLVPVLRNAGGRAGDEIRAELDRLIKGARERSLAAGELRGATITLTNYGMIAGLLATPVVVPPQIAILGSGRISDRLVPDQGGPRVARIVPLSLTYDHRCVTGGEAARFIKAVIADLEKTA